MEVMNDSKTNAEYTDLTVNGPMNRQIYNGYILMPTYFMIGQVRYHNLASTK